MARLKSEAVKTLESARVNQVCERVVFFQTGTKQSLPVMEEMVSEPSKYAMEL